MRLIGRTYLVSSVLFFSCQVNAGTMYIHPQDSLSVALSSGHVESASTGGISVSFTDPGDQYEQFANASQASGLGANTSYIKFPAPYLHSTGGSTWARASMRDQIVVAPDSCEFSYANTGLEVTCFQPSGSISVPVAPRLSYHSDFNTEVELGPAEPSDGYAWGKAKFAASYSTSSLVVNASRCANDQNWNDTEVPCTITGISSNANLFPTTLDESSSVAGSVIGFPVNIVLGIQGSGAFNMELRLEVEVYAAGRGGSTARAIANALNTFTYSKTGPVFDLPEGYTAWSTSGMIRDNLNYGHYHVFSDGFE